MRYFLSHKILVFLIILILAFQAMSCGYSPPNELPVESKETVDNSDTSPENVTCETTNADNHPGEIATSATDIETNIEETATTNIEEASSSEAQVTEPVTSEAIADATTTSLETTAVPETTSSSEVPEATQAPEPTTEATTGLTASDFMRAMNVGWNLGDSFDSKSAGAAGHDANPYQETAWGNPIVTKEQIDYLASCGFNTIRIPVTWYYNSYRENGQLYVGEKFLARVGEVIQYALDAGMYVIVNSHHDMALFYAGVSEQEFLQVKQDAYDLWHCIADYYKEYSDHLIFEGFNEIDNLKASWQYGELAAAQMNELNQAFVNAVRDTGAYNTARILITPTLLHGYSDKILNSYILPKDTAKDRLIIAVHNYYSLYDQSIEDFFKYLEQYAGRYNTPIIIDECGTTVHTYTTNQERASAAGNYIARAASHNIKCVWWDNGYEYSLIDRRTLTCNEEIIDALINPAPYSSPFEENLNDINRFTYEYANAKNGEVKYTYWGSITFGLSNTDYKLPEQVSKLSLSVTSIGEASDLWIASVIFYDKDGNYLSGLEPKSKICCAIIPENACYLRFCVNSARRNIPLTQINQTDNFTSYFATGDLKITLTME